MRAREDKLKDAIILCMMERLELENLCLRCIAGVLALIILGMILM
jgi:hypothetical protein